MPLHVPDCAGQPRGRVGLGGDDRRRLRGLGNRAGVPRGSAGLPWAQGPSLLPRMPQGGCPAGLSPAAPHSAPADPAELSTGAGLRSGS